MPESAQRLFQQFMEVLQSMYGERIKDFLFPPPVFLAMQGEFLEMDLKQGTFKARFPVLESQLNPYRAMQGGMIAAAVDNTIGPLSAAIAPQNVTRNLEMKYSQPVRLEMGYIIVEARLIERKDPQLTFEARVISPDGSKLATCRSTHWIIDGQGA